MKIGFKKGFEEETLCVCGGGGCYLVAARDFRKSDALEKPASYSFEFGMKSQASFFSIL